MNYEGPVSFQSCGLPELAGNGIFKELMFRNDEMNQKEENGKGWKL